MTKLNTLIFADDVIELHKASEKVALIHGEQQLTYQALHQYATALAGVLLRNSPVPEIRRVMIWLDKSIDFVISIFGVLKTGAAYIPMDFQMPIDRMKFILAKAEVDAIITNKEGYDRLKSENIDNVQILIVDEASRSDFFESIQILSNPQNAKYQSQTIINTPKKRSTSDIGYIIFTSGSTGQPKGVMIRHESICAFILSTIQLVQYDKSTRYLNVSPLYFDASVVDIFCTFYAEGTLILNSSFTLPNKLLATLQDFCVTDTLLVSSILKLLVSRFANIDNFNLKNLRTIWYGAEACPTKIIKEIKRKLPWIKFIHGYGPTEATHSTTLLIFDNPELFEDEFLPIGKPLSTIDAFAINEQGKIISPNEIGELYIGGIQLFEGYCNDPERTASVVVNDVYGRRGRFYKTGDYVTIDKNGNYIFKGRKDDIIKVAGQLVCLKEVEDAILSHPATKDAVVMAVDDDLFNTKIIGFVIPVNFHEQLESMLREHLSIKLPKYMIPNQFYFLKEQDVPKNANDKIDRVSLKNSYKTISDLQNISIGSFQ